MLVNYFTVLQTFNKWYSNFSFREAALIASVFRYSQDKIEPNSESVYNLKRLSNHLRKSAKSSK